MRRSISAQILNPAGSTGPSSKSGLKRVKVMDFPLDCGNYAMFIDEITELAQQKKTATVCVANVHMFVEARKDPGLLEVIRNADIVTPDGKPLAWALKTLYGIRQERVAGMDLLPDLLQSLSDQRLPVYFYGGEPSTLEKTRKYLLTTYPELQVAGFYSPPFRALTPSEETEIVNTINASSPAVVFVILGCPKQEKWMASVKERVHSVMIGVGGALPVMIGLQRRAPKWMQRNGLEWLFRLFQEPGRLFKRYWQTNSSFLWIYLREFVKIRILRRTEVST